MSEIKRRQDLETKKHPYVIEYKCECGLEKPITYNDTGRPKKLTKCFECQNEDLIKYLKC